MDMKYQQMLDRLYLSLPKEALSKERFELPEIDAFIEGSRTIWKNYKEILKLSNQQDEKHFMKWLSKEVATSVFLDGQRMIVNSKIPRMQLMKMVNTYFGSFVLCHECKKPDTKIIDQHEVKMLKCSACGAVSRYGK
jgi:translation initiation factor 2 subunit 2